MKLVGKWRMLVKGDADHFRMYPWNRRGLDYLLGRLLAGEEVDRGELGNYGITVHPLAETDEIITVPAEPPER